MHEDNLLGILAENAYLFTRQNTSSSPKHNWFDIQFDLDKRASLTGAVESEIVPSKLNSTFINGARGLSGVRAPWCLVLFSITSKLTFISGHP